MNDYPSRVTLFEDGIYRWTYDMDLRKNRYIIRLILKIFGLILGIPAIFIAVMVLREAIQMIREGLPWDKMMLFLHSDLVLLGVVCGMLAGMILLGEFIYAIVVSAKNGHHHVCFEMDETGVALVRNPGSMKAGNAIGTIAVVAGLASGQVGDALRMGTTMAAANSTGVSRFKSTRRVKMIPKYDLFDIREIFGMNQIYVPKEDYEDVKAFILKNIPEKARIRSEQRAKVSNRSLSNG